MKSPLQVADAPKAIGPYSHAQVVRLHGGNRMVFTSGMIGIDPATGELAGADIAKQTEQTLANIAAVLRGAGLTLEDVVKTTVFLADLNDFSAMNDVYARHFSGGLPARSTLAATALPKGARVEIETVAFGRDL